MEEQDTLGESKVFLQFQEQISKVAKINRPVLIIGERGSGKELAAARLHFLSNRWQNSLVTLNCAALPLSLIESELFGYAAGAFTDAKKGRSGRFEQADKGTLFLDELSLIPMNVQEKILRVVEYGTYEKVGSSQTEHVNTRIIGATNADLKTLSEQGKFKQDLLDRLSFEVIFVPPLRTRENDILLLAKHFANDMAKEIQSAVPEFSGHALSILKEYKWPGNIRELKNTVERAVYKCKNNIIDDFNIEPFKNPWNNSDIKKDNSKDSLKLCKQILTKDDLADFRKTQQQLELDYVHRALQLSEGNQKEAADLLHISYDSFRGLYRKYQKKNT